MAKSRDLDIPRLCNSIYRSRRALERFRSNRVKMVRQYVGAHWSEAGSQKPVPVNLLGLYVSVVAKNLIAKNPRVMLSVFERSHKPIVSAIQTWANKEIERMRLADTLARVVVDALFSIGILKVALATPAEAAAASWSLGAGQVFAERVDLDDWVFDSMATDFRESCFEGHRYRVPRDAVKAMLGKRAKNLPPASDPRQHNEQGDERIQMLGRTYQGDQEEYEDMVTLWEIYLPRHRTVLTLASDDGGAPDQDLEPLLEQNWTGPDRGPYLHLGYGVVPGNAMPKAPIQDLYDLHMHANAMYRKLERMSLRIKEITIASGLGSGTEDAEQINNTDDGYTAKVSRIENVKQLVFGGQAVQTVMLILNLAKAMFNEFGGNLALLGGQAPQSPTAAQDKMLNENAGSGIADKQDKTVEFVSQALDSMCWFWTHDPYRHQRSLYSVGSAEIARVVTPEMRSNVPWDQMDVRVDPYSLQHQTPQMRLAGLNQIIQGVWAPFAALAQQQGIVPDWNFYFKKVAELTDNPDLGQFLTIQEPVVQQGGGQPGGEVGPTETTRNYVRESRSQRTQAGTEKDMMQRLMGQNPGGAHTNGQANGVPA